jgi:PBP1b-binding outer membrane lipoprotein LpoB
MKNKYVSRLLSVTIIALLLLLGCASTKYLPSSSKTYSPTSSAVIYYWDKPDRPYVEMGRIEVKAQTEKGMLERFKQKAMEIGADGVFIKSVENQLRSDTQDGDLWFLVKPPVRAEGVAIKFEDKSVEK